jgi:hypothetical protein
MNILSSWTESERVALVQIENETIIPAMRKEVSSDTIYDLLLGRYMGKVSDRVLVFAAFLAGRCYEGQQNAYKRAKYDQQEKELDAKIEKLFNELNIQRA